MRSNVPVYVTGALLVNLAASAQISSPRPVPPPDPQPIYRVTVVARTLQAVNYEHRGGPTLQRIPAQDEPPGAVTERPAPRSAGDRFAEC